MTLLITYFSLAILVSFICSLLEAVLLSTTVPYATVMVKGGQKSGKFLLKFKEKIDRPLAAILTINTVANTIGAAGVGAEALKVFGSHWVALVSGVLTLCILVMSEIIPKTLGAVYWKRLAPMSAYAIIVLIAITYPLVVTFEALARVLSSKKEATKITREELMVSAEMTKAGGELQDQERRVIRNLLLLNNIQVRDILTPRSVLFALPNAKTIGEVLKDYPSIRFSRIPVYGQNLDDITGLVHRFRMSQEARKGNADRRLTEVSVPIHIVPEAKSVADCLYEFIRRQEHQFLVVDEYGGTAGIITLEDCIETLLGVEILDELDSVADMRQYAKQEWDRRKKALDRDD